MSISLSKESKSSVAVDSIIVSDASEISMGINEDAILHVIDRLTDLYTDPVAATVRETMSNAYDATMSSVDRKPIKVDLPTSFSPVLIIEDFGVGMSPETVEKVYSQYGASTKKNKFDVIGAYGLGAKAPLSYCNEYFVETTHNGIHTIFSINRGVKGNTAKIIESKPAPDKHSGTKISIPVAPKDNNRFRSLIQEYSKLMPDIKVEVDSNITHSSLLLLGSIVLNEDTGLSSRVWVETAGEINFIDVLNKFDKFSKNFVFNLGGWEYSNPINDNKNNAQKLKFYVELKPGMVDFSSSRDEITNNSRSELLSSIVIEKINANKSVFIKNLFTDLINSSYKDYALELTEWFQSKSIKPSISIVDDIVYFDYETIAWQDNNIHFSCSLEQNALNYIKELFSYSKVSAFYFSKKSNESVNITSLKIRTSYWSKTKRPEISRINVTQKELTHKKDEINLSLVLEDLVKHPDEKMLFVTETNNVSDFAVFKKIRNSESADDSASGFVICIPGSLNEQDKNLIEKMCKTNKKTFITYKELSKKKTITKQKSIKELKVRPLIGTAGENLVKYFSSDDSLYKMLPAEKDVNASELSGDKGLLLFFVSEADYLSALRYFSSINETRNIYVSNKDFPIMDYKLMLDAGINVYFSNNYPLRSKIFKESVKNRIAFKAYSEEDISFMSVKDAIYIAEIMIHKSNKQFGEYRFSSGKLIDDILQSSFFEYLNDNVKKAVKAIAQSKRTQHPFNLDEDYTSNSELKEIIEKFKEQREPEFDSFYKVFKQTKMLNNYKYRFLRETERALSEEKDEVYSKDFYNNLKTLIANEYNSLLETKD